MSDKLRILITGFGPFPGAPFNPTQPLVARLLRLRRPAFGDVELTGHIFPVTYRAVDRQLPELLANDRPQALLMFGLAARTPYVRIETRARNAVTTLWPDADHTRVRKGSIAADADAMTFGPHTARLLRAAVGTGIDARASRDAGSYLCNYLSWRAIEAVGTDDGPRLAAFVHVPLLARGEAVAAQGHDASHHAGGTGRCRRSDAAGDGEADTPEAARSASHRKRSLTLPPTIAHLRPRLHHAPPHFCVTSALRKRAKRLPPETRSWTSIAAISSEHPPPAWPARLPCRLMRRVPRRRPLRSGATPRNMASGPAAPTIRPGSCSARSTTPRARKCRWRCRRASIAPACCACKTARN